MKFFSVLHVLLWFLIGAHAHPLFLVLLRFHRTDISMATQLQGVIERMARANEGVQRLADDSESVSDIATLWRESYQISKEIRKETDDASSRNNDPPSTRSRGVFDSHIWDVAGYLQFSKEASVKLLFIVCVHLFSMVHLIYYSVSQIALVLMTCVDLQ